MLTPAQFLMQRIFEEGIKPNAEAIGRIAEAGGIAVVVWEVEDSELKEGLRADGWRPDRPVFPMTKRIRAVMAKHDSVTRRWLDKRSDLSLARIFLFVHEGTLLLNLTPGHGISLEPGSTDRERAMGPN